MSDSKSVSDLKHPFYKKLTLGVVILILLSLANASIFMHTVAALRAYSHAHEVRHAAFVLADSLRQSSDDLTRMARTYAVTGDKRYESYFWKIKSIRDGDIPRPSNYNRIYWDFVCADGDNDNESDDHSVSFKKLMSEAEITSSEAELLKKAQSESDDLINYENEAMNAMIGLYRDSDCEFTIKGDADNRLAVQILFGDKYHQAKKRIMTPINDFFVSVDERTHTVVDATLLTVRNALRWLAASLFSILFLGAYLLFSVFRFHRITVRTLDDEVKNKTEELSRVVDSLENSLKEVKELRGLLPVCANCHKIFNDEGNWEELERYITMHTNAGFSHTVCPDCSEKLYPGLAAKIKMNRNKIKRSAGDQDKADG